MIWPKSLLKRVAEDYLEFRKASEYGINPNFIHTIFRSVEGMTKLKMKHRVTEDIYEKALTLLRSNNAYF